MNNKDTIILVKPSMEYEKQAKQMMDEAINKFNASIKK